MQDADLWKSKTDVGMGRVKWCKALNLCNVKFEISFKEKNNL